MELSDTEKQVIERAELDILLSAGMSFSVPKRSLLRYIGKPDRQFLIAPLFLGTLDYLSREFVEMNFSEEAIQENAFGEAKRLMAHNARRSARVVALAVLNSDWKIRWLAGLYAWYFRWHITPQVLLRLTLKIQEASNLGDFTNSIRYLSVVARTATPTTPNLMERKVPGEVD